MSDENDLRSTLEAAYDSAEREAPAAPEESRGSKENTEEPLRDTAPTERSEPEGTTEGPSGDEREVKKEPKESEVPATKAKPDQPKAETEAKADEPKPEPRSTRAPESWKPLAKEHWAKLPTEVQQEVARREREITQTLQQTAEQRKLADRFVEAVRPFEAMIRAENRDPVIAAQELFSTAAFLRTGTPVQKAQLVAQMVKNFGIPIEALDQALAGEEIPPDPDSKIAQMLDQRLKPVMGFIDEVKGLRTQREQQSLQTVTSEIEAFAQDPKNEFFEDVREDMADLMEMASRRNQNLTLQGAYERAIRNNEDIQRILKQRKEAEMSKKEDAASSIPSKGAPRSSGPQAGASLRADIEAAFASVANR